jgi:hypothetical protein
MHYGINKLMEDLDKKTAEDYIRENIEKANALLDLAMVNINERKKISSEMMRSIAGLVDSITTAATSLISAEENSWGLQIRADMVKLKEREIDLKALNGIPKAPQQQNIFVGSFGDLLKQINQPAKMIESNPND